MDPLRLVAGCLARDGPDNVVRFRDRELLRWSGPLVVVGAGKAAARMALACEHMLGGDRLSGAVIAPGGGSGDPATIAVMEAGHPVPDGRGYQATRRLCELVATASGPVLCLISGGASSLLVRPRPPLTLADKQAVNDLLLKCGADITAMNTVRKHLSEVKGGGLLRFGRTTVVTLALSDVIGDDLSVIASGPTVPDPTTYADAQAVLTRFGIAPRVPWRVAQLLERGRSGEVPETLKPVDPDCSRARAAVIGSNRAALEAAATAARRVGRHPHVLEVALEGPTRTAARRWLDTVQAASRAASSPVDCWIAGGETTVQVRGDGRGGRNQEFALALAEALAGTDLCLLSAGSDGVDGPTDAAGAIVDGSTVERARALGLDPAAALANNDSYGFFAPLGDLFRPGPTGTNVMDIKIALRVPSAS